MHIIKKTACGLVAGSLLLSAAAAAEVVANIGVSNNYIWRGLTQSDDGPAVSGGLDYGHGSGLYAGTWLSSIGEWGSDAPNSDGYELDLYGGFAGDLGALGYDVGLLYYAYPLASDLDFYELYGSISLSAASLGLAYDPDASNLYGWGSLTLPLGSGLELGLVAGYYQLEADEDYAHYEASLSKGEFSFALHYNDLEEDPRVSVSWSRDF